MGPELFKERYGVSRETIKKLSYFHDEITSCQQITNLIGSGTLDQIWLRHFSDSIDVFNTFRTLKTKSIMDFGTGAGFPGIVIAIISEEEKLNHEITLVESNAKKIFFLQNVVLKLGLKINLINDRVENLCKTNFDIITARAVAPLNKLLKYLKNFNLKNTTLFFPKGRNWEKELETIKNLWKFDKLVVNNSHVFDNSGRIILVLKNLQRK